MPWIRIVDPADAGGLLRSLYEQIRTPDGHVDQILKVHSLRPRTLQAHLAIYKAVLHGRPNGLSLRERALCRDARKLTRSPQTMAAEDLAPLRQAGLDDAAILDLNQIVAYFADANRTVQGLGVTTGAEPLGLHPDEDADGYRHR